MGERRSVTKPSASGGTNVGVAKLRSDEKRLARCGRAKLCSRAFRRLWKTGWGFVYLDPGVD